MTLDRLWAGWRAAYVEDLDSDTPVIPADACVLCALVDGREPAQVIARDDLTCTVMNAFPYTSGHVMVLPHRHIADLEDLTAEELQALTDGVRDAVVAIKGAFAPDGLNVGLNLGRAGGAGIPGHIHWHVVPRWNGDSNFMVATAEARVLPEPLSQSADKIRAAWPKDA